MDNFDDALKEHKDILAKTLIDSGEGGRVNNMLRGVDSNASDYEFYFFKGQQSKQAKIDELQGKINKLTNANEA